MQGWGLSIHIDISGIDYLYIGSYVFIQVVSH